MSRKLIVAAWVVCAATSAAFEIGAATGHVRRKICAPSIVECVGRRQRLWVPSACRCLPRRDGESVETRGERYEMVELPDSMVDTTVFVGNLCEFVTDEMLSALFQQASRFRFVPACVARNPNSSSRNYGFVAFPTPQEKHAAILQFAGHELNGRPLKVEPIRDLPRRVRVPQKIVAYAHGPSKTARDRTNRAVRRISKGDVERLSWGRPCHKKGYGTRNVAHRLNHNERADFERAARKGYVTLEGTGPTRSGRHGSPLANIHRQWCDAREKPQIILCKASGGRPFDNVIVDLSPLRIGALSPNTDVVHQFLTKWNTETLIAADKSGMVLETNHSKHDMGILGATDNSENEECSSEELKRLEPLLTIDVDAWNTAPVWKLPPLTLGVFQGERTKAKAMARELAVLWEVVENHMEEGDNKLKNRRDAGARKGGKIKMKGSSHHGKSGQDW